MYKTKIEIPILLLTIVMLVLLALSGNLVYKSLSEIIESWSNESKPDLKLVMAKELNLNLHDIENQVKLYALSNNKTYLQTYYKLNKTIDSEIIALQQYTITDTTVRQSVDSLLLFSKQKLIIWKRMLNLHLSRQNEHKAFDDYFEKMDTMLTTTDTIHFQETTKVGFLKRLFGKKPPPPEPVIIDRSNEVESMQEQLAELEKEIQAQNKAFVSREASLLRKNLVLNAELERILLKLEELEHNSILIKTLEADKLANQTYKRLALFAATVFLLLLLILILIFRDLQKARTYQQILHEAKSNAEQLAKAKAFFTATVSHEMRTPVNAIFGLSEQVLQKSLDQNTRKDLEIIHQSTKHLIELVNDTFDFSRLEKNRIELQTVDFFLDDLIESIKRYHLDAAHKKNINLVFKKENVNQVVLKTDEGRVKQILNNLISNAIKFTDQGSVVVSVSRTLKKGKHWIYFEIADTGIGIPEENRENIFNDFVQLETDANKKAGGAGLGLYIVKKLVELLEGNIILESKPGSGTTFKVYLPFQEGNAATIQHSSVESYPPPEMLKGEKVLIVDDEAFNRHLLKNIFTKWQIDFNEAENGKQAVELASATFFKLVLMDVRMPVLNGIEAGIQIKKINDKIKIIALSANNNQSKLEQCFDASLKKPFSEGDLYKTVNNTLEDSILGNQTEKKITGKNFPGLIELKRMANGDLIFLKEMIEIFQQSSVKNIELLEQSLKSKNWQAVADISHKMASPLKHMNATEIYTAVKHIEKQAESKPVEKKILEDFRSIKKQLNELNEYFQTLLDKNFTD